MGTKLYVGNLSYNITENDLQELFAQHGPVSETNLMLDRTTGRPRGFAFVTMATDDAARTAIETLNGREWEGRALTVNEARPREDRPAYGGGGGGGGGGGRDRGSRSGGNRY
jgi:cold-inducible RNA-binding protein